MTKCEVCDAQKTPGNETGLVCTKCSRRWMESPAYERALSVVDERGDTDSDNYDRQFFDWLETRRRERINGFKEVANDVG